MNDLRFVFISGLTQTVLNYSPEGWDDSTVHIERSMKYKGVFRSYTVSLKFVKDGAAYLREKFYTYYYDAEVILRIDKLRRNTMTYAEVYRGTVDMNTFKDSQDTVEVTIKKTGLAELIKKNADTEYEFTMSASPSNNATVFSETVEYYTFAEVLTKLFEIVTEGGSYGLVYTSMGTNDVLTTGHALKGKPLLRAKTSFAEIRDMQNELLNDSDWQKMYLLTVHSGAIQSGLLRQGVTGYDVWNLAKSPKRMLTTHFDYIRSCYGKYNAGNYPTLAFVGSDFENYKNETIAIPSGEVAYVQEYIGLQLSTPVYFMPYVFEFDATIPDGFMALDFNKRISFEYEGHIWQGYLLDAKINLAGYRSSARVKILSSAFNNFQHLKR